MKNQILIPMVVYALYMAGLAGFMFRARLNAIKSGQVSLKYFKSFSGNPPPDQAVIMARHYDNQFQVPIFFFITCLTSISFDAITTFTLGLAWIFVVSRFLHTWIHLGSNKVQYRAAAFGLGWLTLVLQWLQIIYLNVISGS